MTPACRLLTLALLVMVACNQKPPDYPEQLKKIFVSRVSRIDTAVVVDSFQLLKMQPLTAQLGSIINDSIYKVSYYKVVRQMEGAKDSARTDSIAFYQEEMDYMKGQLDSFSKAIAAADTTDLKFGKLVSGSYLLRKKEQTHSDTAYFFFDKNMTLMNAEILDSMVKRSLQLLH